MSPSRSTRLRSSIVVLDGNAEVIDMEATRSRSDVRNGAPVEAANQTVISRRAALGGGLAGLAGLGGLLLFPSQVLARESDHDDSFVLLLKGVYQPVVHGPNLGLSSVNLNDGSYSTTKIYPVQGAPGNASLTTPVGDFYVQFAGDLCAYRVPGGTLAMRFTGGGFTGTDDGLGGQFLDGLFGLTILEATGKYRRFVGGHNLMVDRLHALASGDFDEYCFCFVSRREGHDGRDTMPALNRSTRRA